MGSSKAKPVPTLARKLGITGEAVFTVVDGPPEVVDLLGDVGDAVWQRSLLAPLDVVLAFFSDSQRIAVKWPTLADAAMPAGVVWVAWQKHDADLTEATVRSAVRSAPRHADWVGGQVVNVGDRWLALRFVMPEDTRPVWRR